MCIRDRSQLEKIREYAKRNDYILPDEFVFMDEGISGRHTTKREAFNRMIGTAKQKPKPFDAILLWKFSRFARNREDSIVYKSMLRKQCGIDVISISENVGDDKMSVLIEAMIEAMDEYYSINLAEEVRRGMNEKVSRGEAVSIPSFGYRIENGAYIPDELTAPVVRKIFAEYVNGKGMREIAIEINDSGIRTRRGNRFEIRTVQYILRNPVYIGKLRWSASGKRDYRHSDANEKLIDGTHEPIIDTDLWEAAQKRLDAIPTVRYMRSTEPKEPFMLQGLVRCSACGATLTRSSASSSLQCYAYAHGKCSVSHSITLRKINDAVLSAIEEAGTTGDFRLHILQRVTTPEGENLPAMIAREKRKLERIKDAYEAEVYTLGEYKAARAKVQARLGELQERLTEATARTDEKAKRKEMQKRIISILPTLRSPAVPESVKNSLLKTIVERIVFYKQNKDIEIYFFI